MEYLRRNSRLSVGSETKLNADAEASEAYYSKKLDGQSNFISDVFFLTVAAHHYGLGATEVTHDQLGRDLHEMEKHLEHMQEERAKWLNVNPQVVKFTELATDF